MEQKVKGALLIPLAMVIRSQKELDWEGKTELTAQDIKLIKKGILASAWYDQKLWERMGNAVWKLVGNGTAEGAYVFGYGIVAKGLLNIYGSKIAKDDPGRILGQFASMYQGTFYTSGSAEFQPTAEGGIFKVSHLEGIPIQECFVPFLRGFLTKIVEENKGENVRVECPEEALVNSQKLSSLTYQMSWEKK